MFSTHINGGPRLSMLSIHVGRQMAGEGGRALRGREGGVVGLFPRRRRANPKCLRRAGSRREVRAHILQICTTHVLRTSPFCLKATKGDTQASFSPLHRQTTVAVSPMGWAQAGRQGDRSDAPKRDKGQRKAWLYNGPVAGSVLHIWDQNVSLWMQLQHKLRCQRGCKVSSNIWRLFSLLSLVSNCPLLVQHNNPSWSVKWNASQIC